MLGATLPPQTRARAHRPTPGTVHRLWAQRQGPWPLPLRRQLRREPEIHKVDPESGSTLRLLQGFFVKRLSQLSKLVPTLWILP